MRKFGRNTNQRKALFRSLAVSLILHEKIETTQAKAKAVRPILEKLITKAKKADIHSRRQVAGSLGNPNAVAKMFDLVGPKFKTRPGGYLRITKLNPRFGDRAKMAKIEFVEEVSAPNKVKKTEEVVEAKKETKTTKVKKTTPAKAQVSKDGTKKERKTSKK
ncbi:MAG: 50S ribosomal protein L17 [bacterium]|nr:50S ribosomal protein L17 [bacterium]